jgi:hypothetical protein
MRCPVCDFKILPANAAICPKCESDLTSLKLIQQMEERKNKIKSLVMALSFISLSFIAALIIIYNFTETKIARSGKEYRDMIVNLTAKNKELNNQIASVQDIVLEYYSTVTDTDVILYKSLKGETFEDISMKFYKDKSKYPKILEANGFDKNDSLAEGTFLKIPK